VVVPAEREVAGRGDGAVDDRAVPDDRPQGPEAPGLELGDQRIEAAAKKFGVKIETKH